MMRRVSSRTRGVNSDGSARRSRIGLRSDEIVVGVRASVAEELPRLAHLLDLVQIEVADDELLLVRVADVADELAARIDEVGLPVEVVVAQRLDAYPVDGAHEIAVGQGVRDLLDAPQVLAQAARRGGGNENQLGPVETER